MECVSQLNSFARTWGKKIVQLWRGVELSSERETNNNYSDDKQKKSRTRRATRITIVVASQVIGKRSKSRTKE